MTATYPAEREAQRRPAAPADGGSESVIDRYSQFNGLYCTERDLRIEGSVEGEIQCDGTVTVAPAARVSAKVRARNVVIAGAASGDFVCAERFTLRPTGEIRGEVTAASLVVEKGAFFEGEFHMADAAAAPPPAPQAARAPVAQPAPPARPEPAAPLPQPEPDPAPVALAEPAGEADASAADDEAEIVAVHADATVEADDTNGAGDRPEPLYAARPKRRRY